MIMIARSDSLRNYTHVAVEFEPCTTILIKASNSFFNVIQETDKNKKEEKKRESKTVQY